MDWTILILTILIIIGVTFLGYYWLKARAKERSSDAHLPKTAIFYLFTAFTILVGITSVFAEALFAFLHEYFGVPKPNNFEYMALAAFVIFCFSTVYIVITFNKKRWDDEGKSLKNTLTSSGKKSPNIVTTNGDTNVDYSNKSTQSGDIVENKIIYESDKKKDDKYLTTALTQWLTVKPIFDVENELVGRTKDLEKLDACIKNNKQAAVVNGLGGIGKTTLAKAYALNNQQYFSHIIWLSKNSNSIWDDYTNNGSLLKHFDLEKEFADPNLTIESKMNTLRIALESLNDEPKLLVLDNVEDELDFYSPYFEKLPRQNNWYILATSRRNTACIEKLDLSVLPIEEAKALFCKFYPAAKTDEKLTNLLKYIGRHTLTTELLSKLMAKHNEKKPVNCAQILQQLHQHELSNEAFNKKLKAENYSNEEQSLLSHLLAAFTMDNLRQWHYWWLKHFALLPALSYEYWQLEITGFDQHEHKAGLDDALDDLVDSGWITKRTNENGKTTYECHRLLQEVILHSPKIDWQNTKDVQAYIWNLRNLIDVDQSKEHYIDKKDWLPYCERLWEVLTHCETADFANFLNAYANLLMEAFARYKEAVAIYKKALAIEEKVNGKDSINISTFYSNLALVLKDLGELQQAKQYFIKSLDYFENVLGETHPNTAILYSNLAMVLQDLGDLPQAKIYLEKALASALKKFGEEHPTTATRYSNLALVLKDLGELQPAKEYLEKALQSDLKNFGEFHPGTAIKCPIWHWCLKIWGSCSKQNFI